MIESKNKHLFIFINHARELVRFVLAFASIYNKLNDITARFNALKEDLWLISGLPAEWLTLAG